MKVTFEFPSAELRQQLGDQRTRLAQRVTVASRETTTEFRDVLRHQVRAAGLGRGLENAFRGETYPRGRASLHPGGLVFSKATALHDAYMRGATITARGGRWLAIPTQFAIQRGWASAMQGRGGRNLSGAAQPRRFAQTAAATEALGALRFVSLGPGRAVLVWDNPEAKRRSRQKVHASFKLARGERGIVVFVLVRTTRVKKALDYLGAERAADQRYQSRMRAAVESGEG
jgi:hypothetical protein